MTLTPAPPVTATLHRQFTGDVHIPGDDGYDRERHSWHTVIDPRPELVAEAADARDVAVAVRAAREHALPFAVQATGHGTYLPADGGLLLKTGRMADVVVDPESRTARVGPGARWADVVTAAASYGLAPISGTLSVGVTGYTLGGGAGFLSRTFGYAADSVVSADLVTADGRPLTVSGEEYPDLYWAIRGGGGNFGVVTALELLLFDVPRVLAGMLYYPAEHAADILALYSEWAVDVSDELNTGIMIARMPDAPQVPDPIRGRGVIGIRVFCPAEARGARKALNRLLDAAGTPLTGGLTESTFGEASAALAGAAHPPMAVEQRFDLFRELPGEVIGAVVDTVDTPVAGVEIRHWGGAIAHPGAHAGPAGHRDVPFSISCAAMLGGPDDAAAIDALDGLTDRLRTYATGGSFLNFLNDPARTAAAFTPENYRRLSEVKRTWDPENVFRVNLNIPPAADERHASAGGQ
ncbi:FAD-binding oxidoreductase [Phytoactinopolyspora halotolerans]|uniref:FAD-binding oxidoreductase n=1 Tax=Phytoactinopolyspora halotolerans TaxID=1981512 RepID=A0A6L9SBX4_9ACTN|nr:FAD-binding oxidoreductase [Phytoactinopolyspora halotolerans]NEE02164.1 FAD-binding oxidoreductase [Phytoactinopolyspora halotolerans]